MKYTTVTNFNDIVSIGFVPTIIIGFYQV